MSILWCGGEDIDFPNGATPTADTSGTHRTGYARSSIYFTGSGAFMKSNPFPGGAVTSGWVTARIYIATTSYANRFGLAFGLSGTNKSLILGTNPSNTAQFGLYKTADGVTFTQLALEAGASAASPNFYRIDMQVTSYGATATVKVYLNGALLITFTGDVTVSGMTNFDSVFIGKEASPPAYWYYSEIMVADEDTRAMSLVTMAPTGAGTTDAWTGAYTDVNEVSLNDATSVYTNTVAQDEQFNVTDLPSGTFSIKAVKVAARAATTTGATATSLKLGINSGGTVNVDSGTSISTGGQTAERLMTSNPITSAAWQQSEMNALQLNLRSA